jgi:hypothetical protein
MDQVFRDAINSTETLPWKCVLPVWAMPAGFAEIIKTDEIN